MRMRNCLMVEEEKKRETQQTLAINWNVEGREPSERYQTDGNAEDGGEKSKVQTQESQS